MNLSTKIFYWRYRYDRKMERKRSRAYWARVWRDTPHLYWMLRTEAVHQQVLLEKAIWFGPRRTQEEGQPTLLGNWNAYLDENKLR